MTARPATAETPAGCSASFPSLSKQAAHRRRPKDERPDSPFQLRGSGRHILRRDSGNTRRSGCSRSEEHTSELQSLMRISYAVFCLKKKKTNSKHTINQLSHHDKQCLRILSYSNTL